jgi:hypothetical protein
MLRFHTYETVYELCKQQHVGHQSRLPYLIFPIRLYDQYLSTQVIYFRFIYANITCYNRYYRSKVNVK